MPPVLVRLDQLMIEKGPKEAMSFLHASILDAREAVMDIICARRDTWGYSRCFLSE
ncbi:hypothetical protein [Candidatus Nitrosoglobus terrae]|uniref:hypothetical protein n=1 Tax=Candidatus Nitrosoglobus terrae TaxID=1630141 RepID=UPI0015530683|nr:hypothetical protein [Candidatus Nitrosoglobus terrae]